MVGLHQMHRKQVRFPGNKRSEGWIVPVWGLQTRVQSATICFKQNCFHVRGVDPSDLRMSMKNSPPVNQRAGRFSHFLTVVDPWTMILLPVLCETIRAIGPLVFVRAFWGASFVVKNEKKKDSLSDNHTGANCDQRWHKSSIHMVGGKEWSRHNNTQKI